MVLGVDVSKGALEACAIEGDEVKRASFSNDSSGIKELCRWARKNGVDKAVFESSGGYERVCAYALDVRGFEVYIVEPKRVRDFARALGKMAKTDKIDAYVIALFGTRVELFGRLLHDPQRALLKELLVRRRQIVEMIRAERCRARAMSSFVKVSTERMILALTDELKRVEQKVACVIEEDEKLKERVKLLATANGVGFLSAATLVAFMPELGGVGCKEIASLAGLAPHARDSGKFSGKRRIAGGRAEVRRVLYMAALAASLCNRRLKRVYKRLTNAGKSKKVALIAITRKLLVILNAMARYNTPYKNC